MLNTQGWQESQRYDGGHWRDDPKQRRRPRRRRQRRRRARCTRRGAHARYAAPQNNQTSTDSARSLRTGRFQTSPIL